MNMATARETKETDLAKVFTFHFRESIQEQRRNQSHGTAPDVTAATVHGVAHVLEEITTKCVNGFIPPQKCSLTSDMSSQGDTHFLNLRYASPKKGSLNLTYRFAPLDEDLTHWNVHIQNNPTPFSLPTPLKFFDSLHPFVQSITGPLTHLCKTHLGEPIASSSKKSPKKKKLVANRKNARGYHR